MSDMDMFEGLANEDTILRLAPDSPEAQEIREWRRTWAENMERMFADDTTMARFREMEAEGRIVIRRSDAR